LYCIYILWTIQHLCQQNVGILLLYHNHNAREAMVNRRLELSTVYSAAIFYTLEMCQRFDLLFLSKWPFVSNIILATLIWTIVSVALYMVSLGKQVLQGKSLNVP